MRHGQFTVRRDQRLSTSVRDASVPNTHGVYRILQGDRVLYIGRGGSVRQDGSRSDQGLAKRLTNRHDGKSRNQWLADVMDELNLDSVVIDWRETKELPCLAEARLLQEYFDEHGCLPLFNRSC